MNTTTNKCLQTMYDTTLAAIELDCFFVAYNESRELLGAIRFARLARLISKNEYKIATENAYRLLTQAEQYVRLTKN